ncbi:MAG: type II toxin-antitoxin system HicB family antitoxin [Acidobacteria bacterium]|nr:type II toxin-antitoxin system HicB family antitoxin [Acidobacteriota bacterium]
MKGLVVELIPDPDEGGYTARVPDIPAYGEGNTEDEAVSDLKEALRGYVEAFGLDDALSRINAPCAIRELDIELSDLVSA